MINAKPDYGGIPEADYISTINTPSRSEAYFEAFHKPLVTRAVAGALCR